MNLKRILATVCAVAAGGLFAETSHVMVSLVTPVQAPSRDYDVAGFRLSLVYGECRGFTGFDIGIIDRTADDFTGLVLGGVNMAGGRLYGGQLGLVNWNGNDATPWDRRSVGLQCGILNCADTFCGLQEGFVNSSGGSFTGLQMGFIDFARDLSGLQCGYYFLLGVNVAGGTVRGCQIGLVNYADTMETGLQIGLVNIISHNGWLPVLPIVNGPF